MELSVPVPWGHISAKAWGDPCLSPVLLVHGMQDNAGSFDRLIPKLPSVFYYVCVDLPGHGHSSRFPKGVYIDFMLYINSIYRLVKHLKWTRFCYIGHSLGGRFGTYYSAVFPDQVTKLVLLDSTAPSSVTKSSYLKLFKKSTEKIINLEDKLFDREPPNYTFEEALEKIITQRPFPIKKEAAKPLLDRALKKTNKGYYFSTDQRLKSMVLNPIEPNQYFQIISEIKCDILLIMCDKTYSVLKDGILEKVGKDNNVFTRMDIDLTTLDLFNEKKNFKMVTVEGEHDVHNNDPHLVAPFISDFLLSQTSSL